MPDDELRYDRMVENALRGVVRQSLELTVARGLPGDHHFYITFRTDHPGVAIANHIRARHPDEMTIVLQHQFWDLEVGEDGFAVTLSFGGKSERLVIAFAAVTGFADPSAKFGLQFQTLTEPDDEDEAPERPAADAAMPAEAGDAKVVTLDAFRKK